MTQGWAELLQSFTPLITVLVVALTALFAWIIRHWERAQERKALAAAIFAEIRATIEIIDHRDHVEIAKQYIARYKHGEEELPMPRMIDPDIKPQDFIKSYPVFNANVGKIGILGSETAADVARFYTQAMGISSSLRGWARGEWDDITPLKKAGAINNELALWEETRSIGLQLCNKNLNDLC